MKALALIFGTLFLALLMSVLTMPDWALWARPEWTLLILIYWTLAFPEHCGVLIAGATGLLQDSLTGSLLGKHMLAFSLVIAIVLAMHKRLRMFDLWYQAYLIFFLILLENSVILFVDSLTGLTPKTWLVFVAAMINALIWPWLMVALRGLRRQSGLVGRL